MPLHFIDRGDRCHLRRRQSAVRRVAGNQQLLKLISVGEISSPRLRRRRGIIAVDTRAIATIGEQRIPRNRRFIAPLAIALASTALA